MEDITEDATHTSITFQDGYLIADHPDRCQLLDYRSKQLFNIPAYSKQVCNKLLRLKLVLIDAYAGCPWCFRGIATTSSTLRH